MRRELCVNAPVEGCALRQDCEVHQILLTDWCDASAQAVDRLMAPLFTFVVLASGAPLTGSMGREHYELVNALQNTAEPEFTEIVRKRLLGFTSRWLAAFSSPAETPR